MTLNYNTEIRKLCVQLKRANSISCNTCVEIFFQFLYVHIVVPGISLGHAIENL
jgi:hypothetical protein